MCGSRHASSCAGCGHVLSRRDFVKGCGVALATGGLASAAAAAETPDGKPVCVGVIFLSKEKPSWPHPEFDIVACEKQVLDLLTKGCPGIEFVSVAVRNPADVGKALAMKSRADCQAPIEMSGVGPH